MKHVCDSYCWVKNHGVWTLVQAVAGTEVVQHLAVRPLSYPSSSEIATSSWPDEPPYCESCGHEMLTAAEYDPVKDIDFECHSQLDLEVG